MDGTYAVTIGDRGRLVVPAEIRDRAGLTAGTPLITVESTSGLVVMTREQARDHVRRQLAGLDLVGELLTERRRAAAAEDDAARRPSWTRPPCSLSCRARAGRTGSRRS